jgi:hypothetical protein
LISSRPGRQQQQQQLHVLLSPQTTLLFVYIETVEMGSSKGSQLSGKPRAGIKALVLQRPQYSQMVSSALTDLKQNKGSKVSTIIKKVHSTWGEQLPSDYKKSVGKVINRLVKLGKLEKDDNDRYALTATRK